MADDLVCECGSMTGPFVNGSHGADVCAECAADTDYGYGECQDVDAGVWTICRDVTCANCYPDPCPDCHSPDRHVCVCEPDEIAVSDLKAALAFIGMSLNPDGTLGSVDDDE